MLYNITVRRVGYGSSYPTPTEYYALFAIFHVNRLILARDKLVINLVVPRTLEYKSLHRSKAIAGPVDN
jgi:hypothetical protein